MTEPPDADAEADELAGIRHDMRGQLNAINLLADLIGRCYGRPECAQRVKASVAEIVRALDELKAGGSPPQP